MKINKFKALSVAFCFSVTALWAGIKGMEEQMDKPAGSVIQFAGEIVPNGWLLCDGQQYSNQKYPELYEVVREKYVPVGSWVIEANKRSQLEKYFCVPDLKDRDIILSYIINTGQANGQKQNEILQLKQKINDLEISSAKAWVIFDGSEPTILDSYGVSSVIRNKTGDYTVVFSKSFNSTNYCYTLSVGGDNKPKRVILAYGNEANIPRKKDSFSLMTYTYDNGTHTDPSFVSACFYGKQ